MEVAIGNTPPFQREVREWQHIDPNTGALLSGRLESDRWVNGPLNTYGKMVSHNLSTPDGTQHTQRKQLEILQARTSSGALQVVRAQTVQTSSSRWSSNTTSSSYTTNMANNNINSNNSSSSNSFLTNHNHFQNSTIHNKSNLHSIEQLTSSSSSSSSPIVTQPASISLKKLMQQNATASNNGPLSLSQLQSNFNQHQQKSVDLQQQQQQSHQQQQQQRSTMMLPTENSTTNNKFKHLNNNDNNNVGVFTKHMDFNKLYNNFNERERETINNASDSFSSRGRSVSIEDLTNFDESNFDDDVEPTEWKRVSKIRRSLQFPKSSHPKSFSRPPDLPENSVSVSKIKQELENGRRLNTAMRNNHVDFVALDSILKSISTDSVSKPEPRVAKKASFITAESLKEIRGRLRKLSNEDLYKDDMSPTDDKPPINGKSVFPLTDEKWSTNKIFVSRQTSSSPQSQQQQHNSNSLESKNRSKEKDVNSDDWHTRRKSYGFEKMFQPSEIFGKMESSTDSGIGRSSDLNSNWSPTIDNSQRGTIITFGDKQKQSSPTTPASTSITLFNGSHEIKQNSSSPLRRTPDVSAPSAATRRSSHSETDELKRHSIAVDESRYVNEHLRRAVDRKISLVNLNGNYEDSFSSSQEGILDENGRGKKKVEFCKTEIHFAAESGRVNIVETDGKPPPTNNFRRRRRATANNVSSSYLEAINSGVPVVHFGDTEKKPFEADAENKYDINPNTHVTTTIGTAFNDDPQHDDNDGQSDDSSLRGILKNKPAKPKPYHLGENLENSESLWGVRLKHVNNEHSLWRSSAELDSKIDLILSEPDTPPTTDQALSKLFTKSLDDANELKTPSPSFGYSTKINLSSSSPSFSWQNKASNTTDDNGKFESVHSNLMSITLESPTNSLKKNTTTVNNSSISNNLSHNLSTSVLTNISNNSMNSSQSQPTALPRSVVAAPRSTGPSPNLSRNNSFRKKEEPTSVKLSSGTRQLRDHELSYFGIGANKSTTPTQLQPSSQKCNLSTSTTPINTKVFTSNTSTTNFVNVSQKTLSTPPVTTASSSQLLTSTPSIVSSFTTTFLTPSPTKMPSSQLSSTKTNNFNILTSNNKWQLSNEKPDLIKHSQSIDQHSEIKSSVSSKSYSHSMETSAMSQSQKLSSMKHASSSSPIMEPISEPIYQNIHQVSSPTKYNRKLDLERDERILSELTRAADEIMNTCQEMMNADNEEKKRKSMKSHSNVLDTITEGRQQSQSKVMQSQPKVMQSQPKVSPSQPKVSVSQPKVMKSKAVQVSRNFEDSLRRYQRTQRTSSQSSIESIPQTAPSKPASASTSLTKKTSLVNGHESTASSTKSSIRRRASGSETKRVQRVCSRERMQQSNASSSEDLPNSSAEAPRRPRRTKLVKEKSESNTKSETKTSTKSSSRSVTERSSSRRLQTSEGSIRSTAKVSTSESKSRSKASPSSSSVPLMSSTTPTTTPSKKSHR